MRAAASGRTRPRAARERRGPPSRATPAARDACPRRTTPVRASLASVAEEPDEPADLAERQEKIAAAMDETIERQREVQRRQDELLDHLGRLSRAMDGESGPEPPGDA